MIMQIKIFIQTLSKDQTIVYKVIIILLFFISWHPDPKIKLFSIFLFLLYLLELRFTLIIVCAKAQKTWKVKEHL